ncbi:MAG: hypothetical protein ACWGPN_10380, partial [Gammaproteobacteria bacterium]
MNKIHIGTGVAALMLTGMQALGQGAASETQDVVGQGPMGPVVSEDGATLIRSPNSLTAHLTMPTPVPFSYLYPPPGPFQATVLMGSPEAFSGWIFIFNNP